ncbi:hypothetical protein TNCV_3902571 [Trichonephila clavipes]|nr:hypothetical protein TNCV_3902571 [Trichonephila clavipes]
MHKSQIPLSGGRPSNAFLRGDDESCRTSKKRGSPVHRPAAGDIWGGCISDRPVYKMISVLVKAVTSKCLGSSPVDRDRLNAHPGAKCTFAIGLNLEHHAGDSTFSSEKFQKTTIPLYDRLRYYRSPPPQFRHGTEGEGDILESLALVFSVATACKTFGPTDLTSIYSVCTRRVFGGIGHRKQVFRFGVRCSNH